MILSEMPIRQRSRRALGTTMAATLAGGVFLLSAPSANAATPTLEQSTQVSQAHNVTAPRTQAGDPIYPYAYYPTRKACIDAGNELANSGEIGSYYCFRESYGDYAGLYHLYTD